MKSFFFFLISLTCLNAATVEYELNIAEEPWAPQGIKPVSALTVNAGIPGPTLRFRVGDIARITVKNHLRRQETSIHWHGLLLPNAQDGVPYVTTPPIKAGASHTFEFPLKHPGTYWYHSHTGLQKQRGVYGSIIVEPRGGEPIRTDADHVLLLSDWTRENPNNIMRALMGSSDWYAIRKGNAQSISGAIKAAPMPYPLETCLVTDDDLDEMDERVSTVHRGQTFEFCCKPCLAKFKKHPEKYAAIFSSKQ